MIRRLRIKFTVTAVISVAAVLFVILGIVNGINYSRVLQASDQILDILAENRGTFPVVWPPGKDGAGERPRGIPDMSPETPYEIRYFTVLLDEGGRTMAVNTSRIAAVDEVQAADYGEAAAARSATRGFMKMYRFVKAETDAGMLVIFLDCEAILSHFYSFLTISVITSFAGTAVVFFLLAAQSGKIVRPFAESYEKQRRFIADAGHEIRTPLTIIDADAEILGLETEENEWIQDIHRQVERLRDLTNDLIYLARMEGKDKKKEKVPFPVSETAVDVARSFQSLAKLRGRDLRWNIEPMLSCNGDMQSIRRLFGILLDNAVKYTDEGGSIRFSLARRGRNIQAEVWNTTRERITSEQITHLFERFYRTDASRNSETGGYGIGLSIAEAIVSAHGGKIGAFTKDGRSLCIRVLL